MNPTAKLLLVCDMDDIKRQVEKHIPEEYLPIQTITSDKVEHRVSQIDPQIVLFVSPGDGFEIDKIQYILSNTASVVFFISEKQDFNLLRNVIKSGAAEYIVAPDEMEQLGVRLQEYWLTLAEKKKNERLGAASPAHTISNKKGQVFAFYSGKGGSGRTLLATNFAQTLQLETNTQVLVIDLNLQYGGVESYLGIQSTNSLADLKPVIEELNEGHIRNVCIKAEHSQMDLLLSPRDAETAESITDTDISKLIRTCQRYYDFVVLDLSLEMTTATYAALSEADIIYYILTPDTPSLLALRHVEMLFTRLNIDVGERLALVLNNKSRKNELTPNDLKKILKYPVVAEIRRDFKRIQPFINQGRPLRSEARERRMVSVAKDVHKWVNVVLKGS